MAAAEKSWLSEKHIKYDPAKRTLLATEVEEGGSYTEVMERAFKKLTLSVRFGTFKSSQAHSELMEAKDHV